MDILDLLNTQSSPRQQQRRSSPFPSRGFGLSSAFGDRRPDDMKHDGDLSSRHPSPHSVYAPASRYSPHLSANMHPYNSDPEFGGVSYTSSPMGTSPHSTASQYEQMLHHQQQQGQHMHQQQQGRTSHPSPGNGSLPVSLGQQSSGSVSGDSQSNQQQQTKAFACSTCGKGFARRSDLVRHERIHSGIRPHACPYPGCDKQFIQRSALTVHERVHTGEKPHSCEKCGKPFSDSSSLARHRRIHLGTRPYKCEHPGCQKTFTRRTTLTRHMSHHAGVVGDSPAQRAAGLAYPHGIHSTGSQNGDEYSDSESSVHSRPLHRSTASLSSISRNSSYGFPAQTFFPSNPHLTSAPHMAPHMQDHPNMPPSPPRSHSNPFEAPKHLRTGGAIISPPNSYGGSEASPPPMHLGGDAPGYAFNGYGNGVYYQTPDPLRATGLYHTGGYDPQQAAGVAAWGQSM